MKKLAITYLFFTMSCWLLASIVYSLMVLIMPYGHVFGHLYRMFLYHYAHPYQYIFLVALIYGLVATLWFYFWGGLQGWKRITSIIGVMLFTLLISLIPGGLLWAIHDIQYGFVPSSSVLKRNLFWAAKEGLLGGPIIIARSTPYNIIGCILGYFVTDKGEQILRLLKFESRWIPEK